ncbi:hypothetical protein CBL_04629 [Carabus blaptoides fortunei]
MFLQRQVFVFQEQSCIMLSLKCFIVTCSLAVLTVAHPTKDVEIVESTIREVRAAAPEDLLLAETNYGHNYAADGEDSVGYLKRSEDGGSDGYKQFDSYHKKDGDKYGYEKHTSFGKADHAEYDAGSNDGGSDKSAYNVAEELDEDEGDSYGPSEKFTDGGADEHYTEGDSEHYSEGEGDHHGYGESAKYSAGDEYGAEEHDDY